MMWPTTGGVRGSHVARFLCEAFHGEPPTPAHQAAHWDGNCANDRADNLRWATRRENYQDQVRHGTSKRGEGHHIAILTDDIVHAIRAQSAGGAKQADLARQYGIGRSHIHQIINRRMWSHI